MKGAPAVAAWVLRRMNAEWAKRKGQLCANADRVYAKLKAAGADTPSTSKWNGLSCDQKMAFIAALGPYGVPMLVAGALVSGFVSNAAGEFKRYGGAAAKSLGSAAKSFSDSVTSSASSAASSVAKSVGLGAMPEAAHKGATMRQIMDVDFGYLGNFGAISGGGGRQVRGNFGGLGATAPSTTPTYASYIDSITAAVQQATTSYKTVTAKPAAKAPSPAQASYAPAPRASAPASAGLPSWVLPAVGLGLVGALAFSMSRRR